MTTCHHYHRIHPRLRGVRLSAPPKGRNLWPRSSGFPDGTLEPAQILKAYGFTQNQFAAAVAAGAGAVKIGVGSLGGGVVQGDVDAMCAAWGMPAPKITVRTVGGAVVDTGDQDSCVEDMLDLIPTIAFTWWYLTGTPVDVTICFGPNASGGMELVVRDLMAAGVSVMSWSWGSAESGWDPAEKASLSAAFLEVVNAGITVLAAAGDNSIDDGTDAPSADYPAGDPCVWAVGGTHLEVAADGSRAAESAWGDGLAGDEGGGGGYDPTFAVPSYQKGAVPANAPGRGVPDTAANADPNSGWIMCANGSWTVVGGTSAAAPFTAALVAVAKAIGKNMSVPGLMQPALYQAPSSCFDITVGSNGDPAAVGWDPATGLGTPNGAAFISTLALLGKSAQPVAVTPPVTLPPTMPPPAVVTADDAAAWAGAGIKTSWPKDGNVGGVLVTLGQAQGWASAGLAANWIPQAPATSGKATVRATTPGIVVGITPVPAAGAGLPVVGGTKGNIV